MSDEAKVKELFAVFGARSIDLDGQEFKVNRAEVTAQLLRVPSELQAERARRWRRQAILAAAASVVVGAGAWLGLDGAAPVVAETLTVESVRGSITRFDAGAAFSMSSGAAPTPISASSQLASGVHSGARVRTRDGLQIELFESSRLALGGLRAQPSSSVQLLAGGLLCRVPSLGPGRQFSVMTPDAEVVVHGTVFSVLVSGMASAARSCVRVEQGRVVVKSAGAESTLGPGETWGCSANAPTAALAPAVEPSPGPANPAPSAALPPKRKDRTVEFVAPRGTLDQENTIFQAGLAAEREGRSDAAVAAFEQLLTRYPQSPLASDARAALTRVKRSAKSGP